MKLKFLLLEMSQNATLYHRSTVKYNVGDEIKPQGRDYVKKSLFERALEAFRKKYFPNAPSRFDGVFATIVPRSRFRSKGYLYTVKMGSDNYLMTNSYLIDDMDKEFTSRTVDFLGTDGLRQQSDEDLMYYLSQFDAKRYFKGITGIGDKESIEILADKLIVTEVHDEKAPLLRRGDRVVASQPIEVSLSGYIKESELSFVQQVLSKLIKGDIKVSDSSGDQNKRISIKGMLNTNTKLWIMWFNDPMQAYNKSYRKEYDTRPNIQLAFTAPWRKSEKVKFPFLTLTLVNFKRDYPLLKKI